MVALLFGFLLLVRPVLSFATVVVAVVMGFDAFVAFSGRDDDARVEKSLRGLLIVGFVIVFDVILDSLGGIVSMLL